MYTPEFNEDGTEKHVRLEGARFHVLRYTSRGIFCSCQNCEINRVEIMNEYYGCGNHSCYIKKPTGVGANGPCRCLSGLDASQRQNVIVLLRDLRDQIETLTMAINALDPHSIQTFPINQLWDGID